MGLMAVLLATGTACPAADARWGGLLKDPPFGAGPVPAEAAPAATWEFRGYVAEGQEQFFCVYDSTRQRSFWLRQNERTGALAARHFDAGSQVLTVAIDGREVALPLKQAKVLMSALLASGASAATAAPAAAEEMSAKPVPVSATSDEELTVARQRANEIRQRYVRAARQTAGEP